jgi:pimeloyl-ACP methyl ester carboxylesterase
MKYLLILAVFICSGCSVIQEVRQQVETIDQRASISGKVVNKSGQRGPVLATLLKSEGNYVRWIDEYQVSANGAYKFFTRPGVYTVGAFIDLNDDGEYQTNEPATYLGENKSLPSMFTLRKRKNKILQTLTISKTQDAKRTSLIISDTNKAMKNVGRVISLRDRMFSRDNAVLGLFRPLDFSEQVGGGLFLLRKYRQGRIPVIFVHGINGTPTDWKAPIKALDLNKFQPFVFYYASGLPLDMVSEFLLQAINKLQSRHRFPEFYIAAHSMGGLVTRSFVKKYVARENPARIGLVMTVNSPMKGLKSAQTGVKYFPIVVPAWRDVAYKSKFVRELQAWPWPGDIPYHLVFAYLPDEAGDGVVELESQIPRSLQKEAAGLYGFEGGHADLLRDKEFVADFNEILANSLE